jgi:uncharacterized protein YrrD
MDFRIGRPVMAEDGRAGTLDRLIFDPVTDQVRGLVVREAGLLPNDVVVPLDRVLSADEKGVRVRGTVEEIAGLEGFSHAQFTEPPEAWLPPPDLAVGSSAFLFPVSPYAVGAFAPTMPMAVPADEVEEEKPPGSVDLSADTVVNCTDGLAGTVDRVLTEGGTDRVTHLIVRRGALIVREIMVPAELIASTAEETVQLSISQEELDRLPVFEE